MGQRVKPGCIARNLYRFPGVTKKVAIGSLVSFFFSNTFSLRTFSPFLVLLYFLFDWKLSSKNLPFPFIIKDSPPSCWPFQWFKRYSSRVYYPKNGFQSLFEINISTNSFILSYLFLSLIKLPRGTTLELWLSAQSSHSHTISNEAHLLALGGQYSFQTDLELSVNLYENGTSLCQAHLQYADTEICIIIFWMNINVTPDIWYDNLALFINYKQSLPQSGIYGTLGNIRDTIVVLVPVPVMLSYWNKNKISSIKIHWS